MPEPSPTTGSRGDVEYRRLLTAALTYEVVPMARVDEAIVALPPASRVSVTCSPVKGISATIELSDRLRAAGHLPVPHLAARMVTDETQVVELARWLRTEGYEQIFVIAGDAGEPLGPYHETMSFLRALLGAGPAVRRVGVAAYPDGHPLIRPETLQEALFAKQDLFEEAGVEGWATTQMCFDPAKVDGWLQAQRRYGLTLPVHLGLAGVVDRTKLMTMGARLGVGASLRYLRKNRGAIGRLISPRHYDPNRLLEPLSPILEAAGVTGVHCFTFNQVEATAAWQARNLGP